MTELERINIYRKSDGEYLGILKELKEGSVVFEVSEDVIKEEIESNVIIFDNETYRRYWLEFVSEAEKKQRLLISVLVGLLVSFFGAYLWCFISYVTGYQIGYMSVAVGFLVGYSIQFSGKAITEKFGFIGATLSLLGCILGNLFTTFAFILIKTEYSFEYMLDILDFKMIISFLVDGFQPFDLLFYGIAIYEGYKFSFTPVGSVFETDLIRCIYEKYGKLI